MRALLLLLLLLSITASGCRSIYRQNVQQGNVLETDQVDALKPGMTKRQVALVLGTPALQSPFRDDRWNYVSSFKDGQGQVSIKRLTVVFDDNVLVRIEGDYEPGKGVRATGAEPEVPTAD